MVSHAHGQGYSDLHFLIPETIELIEFGKGPYYGNRGHFYTAAYVDFTTRRSLNNDMLKIELGDFNTQRFLTMIEFLKKDKQSAYIASEIIARMALLIALRIFVCIIFRRITTSNPTSMNSLLSRAIL